MLLTITSLVWVSLICNADRTPKQDKEAVAVIAKAVAARGGEENVTAIVAVRKRAHGKIFFSDRYAPFTAQSWDRFPNQSKSVIEYDFSDGKVKNIQVFNGKKAWENRDGETKELLDKDFVEFAEACYVEYIETLVPLLRKGEFRLVSLGDTTTGGRKVLGVRVSSEGHRDVDLYFDDESGLLAKTARRRLDRESKEVLEETLRSDYKAFGKVKFPTKVTILGDGKKYMEVEVDSIELPAKIDEKEFSKP